MRVELIEESYQIIRARNAEGYGLLFDIEVLLRELIASELKKVHGRAWQKRGLPPDIRDRVKSAIDYERAVPWSRLVPHQPLYYIDFPDLKKIVVTGSNWPIFSEIFGNKPGTNATLSDIEMIRNKIAHNRVVGDADMKVLLSAQAKVLGSVPPELLENLKAAACEHIPIVATLEAIHSLIEFASNCMSTGSVLPQVQLEPLEQLEFWWFDEDYLGHSVEPVQAFAELCVDYASIVSGIGQAVIRKRWITDRDALTIASRAEQAMENLLKMSRRVYA